MSNPKAPADPVETPSIDARLVRKLADILKDTGLSEIEVEHAGLKIRVARELTVAAAPTTYVQAPQAYAPAPRPAAAPPRKRPPPPLGRRPRRRRPGQVADGRHRLHVAPARRRRLHQGGRHRRPPARPC
jgi:hypothetical protein